MNFDLSEEEEAVKELAGQILGDTTSFEQTRAVESDDEGPGFDRALWARLAESNLIGLSISEALGGQGFSFLALCLGGALLSFWFWPGKSFLTTWYAPLITLHSLFVLKDRYAPSDSDQKGIRRSGESRIKLNLRIRPSNQ